MPDALSSRMLHLEPPLDLPDWLVSDLRSDHAGETGAVYIYLGILSVSRDPAVIAFAREHLEVERNHLSTMDVLLRPKDRSIFLPLWRLAGFLTGFLPALFGSQVIFATVDAVESFVDQHYQEQLDQLSNHSRFSELAVLLDSFREDEVHHRNDARGRLNTKLPATVRVWTWLVDRGSRAAVALARFR